MGHSAPPCGALISPGDGGSVRGRLAGWAPRAAPEGRDAGGPAGHEVGVWQGLAVALW